MIAVLLGTAHVCCGQSTPLVSFQFPAKTDFAVAANRHAATIYVAPQSPETVRVAADAFAGDVEQVTGARPQVVDALSASSGSEIILVGVLGHAPAIDALAAQHKLDVSAVAGKWEAAVTQVVDAPLPGVKRALVVAGADRRGAAYALFAISRQMGVSPWTWWADVPVQHHPAVYVRAGAHVQPSPSVQYRGIFLNDEDWGLRPWAAKKMDPTIDNGKGNIGPHTYERIFELLLRLHANSLWPAMHPGTLAFNAVPENAKLADKWGIVMGSSHSEALLRNNVGEWSEKPPPEGNGPWNYQTNADAMNAYWDKRLQENGKYENFYTVGLRGVHDSGLEAKGTPEEKARLVEDVMANQRKLLAQSVNPDVTRIPQVIWLYKESLDLYRVGMKVPDDVTLGWTDDNYGYIRELPNAEEQKRSGGSGVYYHVSYWGAPHDYLWLCTTPPALIREEMTKAFDHNARKYWILNVGDLKPAEIDIDYFMQLAADEPHMAQVSQRDFLANWFREQFPITDAYVLTDVMTRYYALNFIRKPEFMGFNGYNDDVKRTAFNPDAWGVPAVEGTDHRGQNSTRLAEWAHVRADEQAVAKSLPPEYAGAFFELVGYPVEGSAAMNEKFLYTDRTYLYAQFLGQYSQQQYAEAMKDASAKARAAYDAIQALTEKYNSLDDGKWDGIMSADARNRHVFEMPRTATADDAFVPLPQSWFGGGPELVDDAQKQKGIHPPPPPGFREQLRTVSINAAHFTASSTGNLISRWNVLPDLGISGGSVVFGDPGRTPVFGPISTGATQSLSPWLEYEFTTTTAGRATLALHLLPTFPIDSDHKLRYAVSLDNATPMERDAGGGASVKAAGSGDGPSGADWPQNVLRNSAIDTIPLAALAPGKHTLRLYYRDPGVVFQHIVITFPGAPPAYPVPPETK